MPGPELLDDAILARSFGQPAVARAQAYVDEDRIVEVDSDTANPRLTLVYGRVQGSSGRVYATTVTIAHDPSGTWIESRCSCPVGRLCKHAAALVLSRKLAVSGEQAWERQLTLLLDELDESAQQAVADKTPLALQVELAPTRSSRHATWADQSPVRGALRIRPVRRGARGTWVRTGASWSEVSSPGIQRQIDPAQAEVLSNLLAAHRAATRQPYGTADSHLALSSFGPHLWQLLSDAARVGLALVPAGALSAVRVLPDPVALRLDVNAADGSPAQVQVGVAVESRWFTGDRLEVLGTPGHGVALWTPSDTSGDSRRTSPPMWELLLARLSKPAGAQVRRLVATAEPMTVPRQDVATLVDDVLPQLQRHVDVVSSDGSVRLPETAEPRLALTVTWKAADEVHIAWWWRYRLGSDDRVYAFDESRGMRGVRRPDREAEVLDALVLDEEQRLRLCGSTRAARGLIPEQTFTGATAVAFAHDTLAPLESSAQVEIDEIGARPDYHEVTDAPVVRFEPRAEAPAGRTDWLDLEVVVTVGGRHIGLATLLEAMTWGAERLVLSDGAHLRIDRPEFAQLRELVMAAREMEEQPRDGVRVHRHDLGLWTELAEIGLIDAQASQWVRSARALSEVTGLPEVLPTGVDATLRGYQVDGFRWLVLLWQLGLGGVLADDMGLGKTVQTLALIAHAKAVAEPTAVEQAAVEQAAEGRRPSRPRPFLVVAPTSVVATWAHEAATFTPGLEVRTVTESQARRGQSLRDVHEGADLVVTSYTLLRLEADEYAALDWGGLVLDEAQMVKNHLSKAYQSVRRIDAPFRLALTGTPMENRLMELWSLLSVVAPGLYPYPQRFTEMVANPVEKEGDTQVLERFRRRIRPFLLRRTKELVAADLPAKQEQVLEVALNPKHRRIYQTHLQRERQRVLGLLGDFDRQRIAIFRSLTRLRQLSLDAGLVNPEYDGVGSAKLDVLVDHLSEVIAEGHRALVFSQFTSFLTRVRHRLDAEGIESKYLDGRTRRRADVVSGFKRGEGSVFLISLKAGGVGLTLTEADYVFVLDPWWNPAVEAQAVDRAHRIGQRKPVMVYRLVATDTVEEKVMALKARKAALFAKVVDGGGGAGTPIGADDVRALLT